jgi:hypothetical protein
MSCQTRWPRADGMHAKRAARTVEKTGESKSTPQRSLSVRCWTVKLKSRRGGGRAGRTAKRAATVLCDPAKRTRPGDRGGEVVEVALAHPTASACF